MTTDNYYGQVAATYARSTAALQATTASERAAAVQAAKVEIEAITERELYRLGRERVSVEKKNASAVEALAERAEATRRELATTILAAVFSDAPDSIASIVARWRIEPTRVLTGEIKVAWDKLSERALVELGERLGDHVLGACFVESIAATVPGGLVKLSETQYGAAQKVVSGLGAFRRAETPDAAEAALSAVESALLVVARRSAGQAVEQHHLERAALRRTNATARDLFAAYTEFDAKQRQADHERMARDYTPPPPLSRLLSSRVQSWLGASGD